MKGLSKFLKILRIKNSEVLKNMADKIGVSSAFLSAIENGHKKVPDTFYEQILKNYDLTTEEKEELFNEIAIANKKVTIELKEDYNKNQEVILKLARNFNQINNEKINRILKILEEDEHE